jgi:hypothetical protein
VPQCQGRTWRGEKLPWCGYVVGILAQQALVVVLWFNDTYAPGRARATRPAPDAGRVRYSLMRPEGLLLLEREQPGEDALHDEEGMHDGEVPEGEDEWESVDDDGAEAV